MLGWSLICVFAIACLVIIAMLITLPIVFLVGGVCNLMPPKLPKNIDTMPKDTQEMYTKIYEQECVEWNNTSKSKRVWTSICSILFAVCRIMVGCGVVRSALSLIRITLV